MKEETVKMMMLRQMWILRVSRLYKATTRVKVAMTMKTSRPKAQPSQAKKSTEAKVLSIKVRIGVINDN